MRASALPKAGRRLALEQSAIHVADAPGRHDPGTGEMKWDDIYKAIAKTGYSGCITLEYLPEGDEVESLMKAVTQMRRDLNSAGAAAVTS